MRKMPFIPPNLIPPPSIDLKVALNILYANWHKLAANATLEYQIYFYDGGLTAIRDMATSLNIELEGEATNESAISRD